MKYNYEFFENLPEDLYPIYMRKFYKEIMSIPNLPSKQGERRLNLDKPKLLSEKIQWLKLYDSTPLKTQCADKIKVVDWCKERIPELKFAKIYSMADSFEELDFYQCPERFVIKTNHACKQMVREDSKTNLLTTEEGKIRLENYAKKFNFWLSRHFAFDYLFELHYKDIQRKVFLQEYIENPNSPNGYLEYKVNCFNGEPVFLEYYNDDNELFICDTKGKQLDFIYLPFRKMAHPKLPANFEKMVEYARILAKDFKLVRVDFFEHLGELYLSELTFTPYSGFMEFSPLEYDYKIGAMLQL